MFTLDRRPEAIADSEQRVDRWIAARPRENRGRFFDSFS
jgi:hypothetical protein